MSLTATEQALLRPLTDAPAATALIFDVDGTLAPIVPKPEDAAVPAETQAELRRLGGRYGFVAGLSGRAGVDARRVVGVDDFLVVGNHGLELDPRADELSTKIAEFRDSVSWPVEDKGLSLSYHYRQVEDQDVAVAELERVAARAEAAGLVPRWGRKVLEIRPCLKADKGTAIRHLLERSGASQGFYAGDDTTDLDAFAGLREAGLDHTVCIAVASEEGPAELCNSADIVVGDTEEFVGILKSL